MINTLETLGVNLKEGVLEIGMLAKYNPWWFIRFWSQSKPIVIAQRKGLGPSYLVYMEYLIESLQKYVEKHPELFTP